MEVNQPGSIEPREHQALRENGGSSDLRNVVRAVQQVSKSTATWLGLNRSSTGAGLDQPTRVLGFRCSGPAILGLEGFRRRPVAGSTVRHQSTKTTTISGSYLVAAIDYCGLSDRCDGQSGRQMSDRPMSRRPSLVTITLVPIIGVLVLPAVTNVAASRLPASWQALSWLAWPAAALLSMPVIVAEIRRRSQHSTFYDSTSEDPQFRSWTLFASRGLRPGMFHVSSEGDVPSLSFAARPDETVGPNIALPLRRGAIEFLYRIEWASGSRSCVYFAAIPMRDNSIDRQGLIEVGADVQDDPRNPFSPHRVRWFPRPAEYDGDWHGGRLAFDFAGLSDAFFTIFGPRINEGTVTTGEVRVWVTKVRVTSHENA
jgi:hypothetical protein